MTLRGRWFLSTRAVCFAFYEFRLDEVVPDDHLVRGIAGVLDLSWVRDFFSVG